MLPDGRVHDAAPAAATLRPQQRVIALPAGLCAVQVDGCIAGNLSATVVLADSVAQRVGVERELTLADVEATFAVDRACFTHVATDPSPVVFTLRFADDRPPPASPVPSALVVTASVTSLVVGAPAAAAAAARVAGLVHLASCDNALPPLMGFQWPFDDPAPDTEAAFVSAYVWAAAIIVVFAVLQLLVVEAVLVHRRCRPPPRGVNPRSLMTRVELLGFLRFPGLLVLPYFLFLPSFAMAVGVMLMPGVLGDHSPLVHTILGWLGATVVLVAVPFGTMNLLLNNFFAVRLPPAALAAAAPPAAPAGATQAAEHTVVPVTTFGEEAAAPPLPLQQPAHATAAPAAAQQDATSDGETDALGAASCLTNVDTAITRLLGTHKEWAPAPHLRKKRVPYVRLFGMLFGDYRANTRGWIVWEMYFNAVVAAAAAVPAWSFEWCVARVSVPVGFFGLYLLLLPIVSPFASPVQLVAMVAATVLQLLGMIASLLDLLATPGAPGWLIGQGPNLLTLGVFVILGYQALVMVLLAAQLASYTYRKCCRRRERTAADRGEATTVPDEAAEAEMRELQHGATAADHVAPRTPPPADAFPPVDNDGGDAPLPQMDAAARTAAEAAAITDVETFDLGDTGGVAGMRWDQRRQQWLQRDADDSPSLGRVARSFGFGQQLPKTAFQPREAPLAAILTSAKDKDLVGTLLAERQQQTLDDARDASADEAPVLPSVRRLLASSDDSSERSSTTAAAALDDDAALFAAAAAPSLDAPGNEPLAPAAVEQQQRERSIQRRQAQLLDIMSELRGMLGPATVDDVSRASGKQARVEPHGAASPPVQRPSRVALAATVRGMRRRRAGLDDDDDDVAAVPLPLREQLDAASRAAAAAASSVTAAATPSASPEPLGEANHSGVVQHDDEATAWADERPASVVQQPLRFGIEAFGIRMPPAAAAAGAAAPRRADDANPLGRGQRAHNPRAAPAGARDGNGHDGGGDGEHRRASSRPTRWRDDPFTAVGGRRAARPREDGSESSRSVSSWDSDESDVSL